MARAVVKSAKRVFDVLELFDRERRPLALKHVCAALAVPASSASVLLKSLVTLGYLDHDRATRTYFPTMRIALLGQWVQRALFGEGQILRFMRHLHAATGETVLLATQSDIHAQYVHAIQGTEPFRAAVQAGTLRPLAASGVGFLLLSRKSDPEIEALCRRIDAEHGPGKRIDRAALRRDVGAARRNGYVFSKHTVIRGSGIIAMLLPEVRFGRTLAVGVGGPVRRLEENEAAILAAMRIGMRKYLAAQKKRKDTGISARTSRREAR